MDNKLNLFIQKMNGYLIYSIYKKLKLQAFGACFTLKVIQLAEYTTFFLQKLRKEFFTGATCCQLGRVYFEVKTKPKRWKMSDIFQKYWNFSLWWTTYMYRSYNLQSLKPKADPDPPQLCSSDKTPMPLFFSLKGNVCGDLDGPEV